MHLDAKNPKYKHDCESCYFLGSNEIVDFYFCNKHFISKEGSMIIRLGDNPIDYFSMPVDVVKDGIHSGELDEESVFVSCYNRFLKHRDEIFNS